MIRAASLFALALATLAPAALADGLRVRTAYGLSGSWAAPGSLDVLMGFQNRQLGSGSVRVMWDKSVGPFQVEFHSHLAFSHGDDVKFATALAAPAPPASNLFDLTQTWQSTGNTTVTNTIDRLSVSFGTPNFYMKLGRQAITWGNGTVFHPGDIVAPFSPTATDTSYKPGADMIYAQYLFDNGSDIQLIAVPRGVTLGGPIVFTSSTYALRASTSLGSLDTSLMLARDRGDSVATLDLSGPLGGASWNAEYVHWALDTGATHSSWLFNISNFGALGEMNIAYFAEYFHNGFGVASSKPVSELPDHLTKRMSTGQVFLGGQDFLALGAQVQITADLSIAPNAIVSLNDHSALGAMVVNYTLGDNTNLMFNYLHPFGAQGTEFGGRETAPSSDTYVGPSKSATLQLVHFF